MTSTIAESALFGPPVPGYAARLTAALADPERLALLRDTGLLDTPHAVPVLARAARVAARALRAPLAQVNLVTDRAQVPVAAHAEVPHDPAAWRGPVSLAYSYCQHTVAAGTPIVVEDARVHPLVRDSQATAESGIVGYLAVPLRAPGVDGRPGPVLGTVCVVDTARRAWTAEEVALLEDVAGAAMDEVATRLETRAADAERRRAERDAEAARVTAEAARVRAEEANRAKSQFLATMSHELRTPLNAIAGYAELLDMGLRGPVTEAQRADLARIRRSQQHLLGLINDVLSFAKLEAGTAHYDMSDVSLAAAVDDVAALVRPQLSARGIALACDAGPAGLTARADSEKVRQVLLNLVTNAGKFTDPPGRVAVTCEADEGVVRVRVGDTGIGIPADRLEHIFAPFVQVDPRLSRAREGAGLGLAISRDLARGMGGDLAVESTVGAGSTFTLTLPRAAAGGAERRRASGDLAADAVTHCAALLAGDSSADSAEDMGIRAVLAWLNARTAHRYTGLYRFDPPVLRSLALVDRHDPAVRRGADAPLRETYCALVGEMRTHFATADAGADARLGAHPARAVVQSYCGALVRDAHGAPVGTLCHFDPNPRPVPEAEVAVLEAVAGLLGARMGPA